MGLPRASLLILSAFLSLASFSHAWVDGGICGVSPDSQSCAVQRLTYPPKIPSTFMEVVMQVPPGRVRRAPSGYPAKIVQKTGNGVRYTTWICAKLNAKSISVRGTGTTKPIRRFMKKIGAPGDQAGHIIAAILGFPGNESWNIAPIAAPLNNGKMSTIEGIIRKIILRPQNKKKGVTVYIRLKYRGKSNRPYEIQVLVYDAVGGKYFWTMKNPR